MCIMICANMLHVLQTVPVAWLGGSLPQGQVLKSRYRRSRRP